MNTYITAIDKSTNDFKIYLKESEFASNWILISKYI